MKTMEFVEIAATAQEVWSWLVDASQWTAWNVKVKELNRERTGGVVSGETFQITLRLSEHSQPRQDHVEVKRCHPPHHLVLRQTGQKGQRTRVLEVEFALEPTPDGVAVRQTIDWAPSGLPRPVQWLVWLLSRYGRARGPGPLDELKRLVESRALKVA